MTRLSDSPTNDLPAQLRSERGRWDRLARDPYYAVINEEGNRDDRLDASVRQRFDQSGEEDVAVTLAEIRRWIDPAFHPREAVDLGCGVGRLTLPLARACDHVTGVDISDVMLREARHNAASHGAENVRFVSTGDYFEGRAEAQPRPDFIHAFIVLQHIPPRAGMWLAGTLLDRLAPGGVGALHFTFARRAPRARRLAHLLRRTVPGVNVLANLVQHRRLLEPMIPMHEYDLAQIFTLLGDAGCAHVHARLTDHGGHLGAMLIFRKAGSD
jgi:2-polyprenyl-3-methyl-5-hydroxy-6-metoxy-1,4-benzoquinol methylase